MKKALVNTLLELMEKQDNIYVFTGDLGFGVMNPIIEKYGNHFINVGICEQNLTAAATGMAMEGNIVFTYSIGNFPTLRCMEQIRNDACYHNANVKIISVGGGFAYGQLGMSHHATEDVAMLRALPNMTVLTPADTYETKEAIKLAVKIDGPVYIRLGRGGEKDIKHLDHDITKPMQLILPENKNGSNTRIALIGSGIVMPEVESVAEELSKKYCVKAYSLALVKPISESSVIGICKEAEYVFTIEEHQITGGVGSLVAEIIAENNITIRFKRIGMKNQFTQVVGSPNYLRKEYGLDKDGILEVINFFIEGK